MAKFQLQYTEGWSKRVILHDRFDICVSELMNGCNHFTSNGQYNMTVLTIEWTNGSNGGTNSYDVYVEIGGADTICISSFNANEHDRADIPLNARWEKDTVFVKIVETN